MPWFAHIGLASGTKRRILMENEKNVLENQEEEGEVISLTDEDGNELEFEYLDQIEYEGGNYAVLLPVDEDEETEDDEVVIFKVISADDENEEYEIVEDEEMLQTLFDIFKEKNKDEFDFV